MTPVLEHLRRLIADPMVASLSPTRRDCVERVCCEIDFAQVRALVELGPGDGAFTEVLRDRMLRGTRLVAIERDEYFAQRLSWKFHGLPVDVVHGNALDLPEIARLHDVGNVDCVVSGIPLSMISRSARAHLLSAIAQVVRPAGMLLIYQSTISPLPSEQLVNELSASGVMPTSQFHLWLNLPPLYVLVGKFVSSV